MVSPLWLNLPYKVMQGYTLYCKRICTDMQIPQTAFDILLFLANNPERKTARDIVEIRRIKANLVSLNVDKLVREGYLKRQTSPDDRRRIELIPTEKAQPMIERGRAAQQEFLHRLMAGIDELERARFIQTIQRIDDNITRMTGDRT